MLPRAFSFRRNFTRQDKAVFNLMDVPAKTIYRGDNLDDEKRDLRAISHTLHNSAREGLRRCPN